MPKLNALIAGSTGYIGIQLIRLLIKHPNIKIKYLCGNLSKGKLIQNYNDQQSILSINKDNDIWNMIENELKIITNKIIDLLIN